LGSRVVVGGSWGRRSWTQALEADQYTLQSFKSVFYSTNLDRNMPKNALYFGKTVKIASALGSLPPILCCHPEAVDSSQCLLRCYTHLLLQTFSAHDSSANTRLIAVKKNKSNNSKCFLLLPHLPNFFLQTLQFCWWAKTFVKVTSSDLNLLRTFFNNCFFGCVNLHEISASSPPSPSESETAGFG